MSLNEVCRLRNGVISGILEICKRCKLLDDLVKACGPEINCTAAFLEMKIKPASALSLAPIFKRCPFFDCVPKVVAKAHHFAIMLAMSPGIPLKQYRFKGVFSSDSGHGCPAEVLVYLAYNYLKRNLISSGKLQTFYTPAKMTTARHNALTHDLR